MSSVSIFDLTCPIDEVKQAIADTNKEISDLTKVKFSLNIKLRDCEKKIKLLKQKLEYLNVQLAGISQSEFLTSDSQEKNDTFNEIQLKYQYVLKKLENITQKEE